MPLPALSRFQAQLLEWFAAQQRKLPWRQDYAPYGVWISEMMLQQTRVTTVLSYYERWMRELPDIASVAAAEEAQLLKLWEGLGYYSRVRNIQKAARQICAEHGGAFPTDFAAIRRLPGIGPYTAGAIASIAFEQDRPIVDGNVVRVACRVFHITDNPKESDVQKRLWNIAAAWIPAGQARHFNQAVMELGATVCHVQQPTCLLCPVQEHCQAYAAGTTERVPYKAPRRAATPVTKAVLLLEQDNAFLVQRPEVGLMQGLWLFPEFVSSNDASPWDTLCARWQQARRPTLQRQQTLAPLTHSYTTFRATLHPFQARLPADAALALLPEERWVPSAELWELAMPSAHSKLRAQVCAPAA